MGSYENIVFEESNADRKLSIFNSQGLIPSCPSQIIPRPVDMLTIVNMSNYPFFPFIWSFAAQRSATASKAGTSVAFSQYTTFLPFVS